MIVTQYGNISHVKEKNVQPFNNPMELHKIQIGIALGIAEAKRRLDGISEFLQDNQYGRMLRTCIEDALRKKFDAKPHYGKHNYYSFQVNSSLEMIVDADQDHKRHSDRRDQFFGSDLFQSNGIYLVTGNPNKAELVLSYQSRSFISAVLMSPSYAFSDVLVYKPGMAVIVEQERQHNLNDLADNKLAPSVVFTGKNSAIEIAGTDC